jgi:pimeloyl-ACP methyl ester carboxylesterase
VAELWEENMQSVLKVVACATAALSLCACAHMGQRSTTDIAELRDEPPLTREQVTLTLPVKDDDAAPYVRKFALMALFAKTAYRKDLVPDHVPDKPGCAYIGHPEHPDIRADMPGRSGGSGWRRLETTGACYNEHGLYYETYVHETVQADGKKVVDQAVIAIRGTEPQTKADWIANMSGVIWFPQTEYSYAKTNILPLIDHLHDDLKIIDIYLTGHSLGGGLAQSIAHLSPHVTETFTFNTSPVTNWFRETHNGGKLINDPTIHRAYMQHEWLEYLRYVSTRFNAERHHRTDYRFRFIEATAFDAHDMSHLACQFAARVGKNGADYDYSYADAQATLKKGHLCPDDVKAHLPASPM